MAEGFQTTREPEPAEGFDISVTGQKDRPSRNVQNVLDRLDERIFDKQLGHQVSASDKGVRIDYDPERPFPDEQQRRDAHVGPGVVRSLAQAAARGEAHSQDRAQFRIPEEQAHRGQKRVFNLDTSRLTQLGASLKDQNWMALNSSQAFDAYRRGAAFAADVLGARPDEPPQNAVLRPYDADHGRPPVRYRDGQEAARYSAARGSGLEAPSLEDTDVPHQSLREDAQGIAEDYARRYMDSPETAIAQALEEGLIDESSVDYFREPLNNEQLRENGELQLRSDTFYREVYDTKLRELVADQEQVEGPAEEWEDTGTPRFDYGGDTVQSPGEVRPAADESDIPDTSRIAETEQVAAERSAAPAPRRDQDVRRHAREGLPPAELTEWDATRQVVDEQQRQGRYRRPDPRPEPVHQLPFAPDNMTTAHSVALNRYAEVGNALLRDVGVDFSDSGPVVMTDGSNLVQLRQHAVDQATHRVDADANRMMLDQLKQDMADPYRGLNARVMFLRYGGNRTRPAIYLSPRLLQDVGRGTADRAVLHELGHIVMRDAWSRADADTKQALQELLGPLDDFAQFEENFAEAFVRWSERFVDDIPGTDQANQRIRDQVRRFFADLHRRLRRLWNRARQRTETDVAFATFMESLVNRVRERRGEPRKGLTAQGISNPRIQSWIRQLNSRRLVKGQGFIRFDPALSESLDYGGVWPSRAKSGSFMDRVYDRAQQVWDRHGESVGSLLEALWRNTGQPLDHQTRAIRNFKTGKKGYLDWLGDYFRRPGGERKQRGDGLTIPHEVRMLTEQYLERFHEITRPYQRRLNWRDFTPFVRERESHPVLKAVDEWHIDGTSIRERTDLTEEQRQQALQLHQDLQELLGDVREQAIEHGVPIGRQDDYWPFSADPEATHQLGREHLVERTMTWARDHMDEARRFIDEDLAFHERRRLRRLRMAQDDQEAVRDFERQEQAIEASRRAGHQPMADTLTDEQVLDYMRRFGHALYDAFTNNEGVIDPASSAFRDTEMGDFQSPSFEYGKARRMPNSLHGYLHEFRERGVNRTVTRYIQATVQRAVWTRHFALHDEVREIDRRYQEANQYGNEVERAQALRDAAAYKEDREQFYEMYYGINIYDPAGGLKKRLRDEYDAGRLSPEDYKRLTDEIIPSYMGIWGNQSTHIGWRRLQQAMMMYQSFRILSMGVFSQFVDPAFVAARAPAGYRRHLAPVARELLSREGRQEAVQVARALGVAQRDALTHLHTDHMSAGLMTEKLERLHQGFFRANLMHYATNMARTFSAALGARLFQVYYQDFRAGKVDRSFFDELNVTPEEVGAWLKEWQSQDRPLSSMVQNGMYRHERVISALQQFVDETIVFPNPAIRARIGNHAKTKLFWHLKSFMWGFHLQVLGRAFNQALEIWGEREGPARLASALPMITLAAMTMPIAMLSMELRWLITDPAHRPGFGSPMYAFEAMQRAGLPGMFQLYIDADVSEDYGRIGWLSAVGGPSVAHAQELVTEGLTNPAVLERSMPAYPIIRFLRDDVFGQ
ncbi:MAG: hypothetical protein ACOCTG_00820 [Bacteroidota bacterium]